MTRHYDGTQIGVKRFEMYLKVACSMILHHPFLTTRNLMHKPWSEDYCMVGLEGSTVAGDGPRVESHRGGTHLTRWRRPRGATSNAHRGGGRNKHGPPI